MKTEKIIDYLQFTYPEIPGWLGDIPYIGLSPLAFYKTSYEFTCGARVFFGNKNSDLYLVQMSGKACDAHKITDCKDKLKDVLECGGKFSRVDFAVTVEGLKPLEYFYAALRNRIIECKRFEDDAPKVISDAYGNPETIYIGDLKKRGTKGVFRAYNKGLELGIDHLLTRFELETRKGRAMVAARRYTEDIGIGQLITDVIDIPDLEWWSEMMSDTDKPLPRYRAKDKPNPIERRWNWLIKQVAPALGRLIALEEVTGGSRYKEFLGVVAASARKYQSEHLTEIQ